MDSVGQHNGREVILVNPESAEWVEKLIPDSFMLLVAGDNLKPAEIEKLAEKTFPLNPLFIHCCGNNSSQVEDCFHEEIVSRAVAWELSTGNEFDYEQSPQTAFDASIDNALWFSCVAAFNDHHEIKKIILVNYSPDKITKAYLTSLLKDFADGKLPD